MEISGEHEIKCIVWDLDNTIWNGVLLEDSQVQIRENMQKVLDELDHRGILHSIASRNDYKAAMEKLRELGIDKYFLYPQIGWRVKSEAIAKIQRELNIGMDTILFIDDDPFERDEVNHKYSVVRCLDAQFYKDLLSWPSLMPRYITSDARYRRQMYLENIVRQNEEAAYTGSQTEFLASIGMCFTITRAAEQDLKRAEELTVRSNQLNATGITYNYDELLYYSKSPMHLLLVCELVDRYGSYGKIGLALIDTASKAFWNIKLLLMSCRVMSRGVGSVLLTCIMKQAKNNNRRLRADFIHTGRNRQMYITYKFARFIEKDINNSKVVLENDLIEDIQPYPEYIKVNEKNITI